MADDHSIHRRNVLRTAAVAGTASVAGTGIATAESESDRPWDEVPTNTVSDVHFVELGFEFDADIEPDTYACHGVSYQIDDAAGELFAPALTEEERAQIESEDALLKQDGFHALPTVLNRSDVEYLPLTTSTDLAPEGTVRVEQPVRIPAVHVTPTSEESVEVKIGGSRTGVAAGTKNRIALDPRPVQAANSGRGNGTGQNNGNGNGSGASGDGSTGASNATPEVVVKNHGVLTVEVAESKRPEGVSA